MTTTSAGLCTVLIGCSSFSDETTSSITVLNVHVTLNKSDGKLLNVEGHYRQSKVASVADVDAALYYRQRLCHFEGYQSECGSENHPLVNEGTHLCTVES